MISRTGPKSAETQYLIVNPQMFFLPSPFGQRCASSDIRGSSRPPRAARISGAYTPKTKMAMRPSALRFDQKMLALIFASGRILIRARRSATAAVGVEGHRPVGLGGLFSRRGETAPMSRLNLGLFCKIRFSRPAVQPIGTVSFRWSFKIIRAPGFCEPPLASSSQYRYQSNRAHAAVAFASS